MANLTDFLPDVRAQVPGAIDDTLIGAIRWAVRRFCHRTQAYFQQLDDLVLTLNSGGPYTPMLPVGTELADYMSATQNGIPVYFRTIKEMQKIDYNWQAETGSQVQLIYPINDTQVNVFPLPTDITYPIQIWAALSISVDANTCPDFILNKYDSIITAGAAASLFAMAKQEWTDKKEAADLFSFFNERIADVRIQVERGYSTTARFAKIPFFAGDT